MEAYLNQVRIQSVMCQERCIADKVCRVVERIKTWLGGRLYHMAERLAPHPEAAEDPRVRMLGRVVTEARSRLFAKEREFRTKEKELLAQLQLRKEEFDYVMSECEQLENQRDAAYRERDRVQRECEDIRSARRCQTDCIDLAVEEVFEDEAREHVLEALDEVARRMDGFRARRREVLKAVLARNARTGVLESRRKEVESIFRGKDTLSGADFKRLEHIGVRLDSDKNHYKFRLGGVMCTASKTPSDWRAGAKRISEMNNKFF